MDSEKKKEEQKRNDNEIAIWSMLNINFHHQTKWRLPLSPIQFPNEAHELAFLAKVFRQNKSL